MSFWPQLTRSSVSIVNITHIKIAAQSTPKYLPQTVVRIRVILSEVAKAGMMACNSNPKKHISNL